MVFDIHYHGLFHNSYVFPLFSYHSSLYPITPIGHERSVLSVSYFPNGTQIVSGSQDNTILIWDSLTHAIIKGPLTGHSGPVTSVAYSSDGSLIISGS